MTIKSYEKCSHCDAMIQPPPKHRLGRCGQCWIDCLEATIDYVAKKIIDNEHGCIKRRNENEGQSTWEFKFAIAAQYAFNLLQMIGRPHEEDTTS